MNYDVLVVGSGPAGLAAAVAARGRDKSVLVVGNPWQESPLARAERIDNYLGLPGVNGRELMEHFSAHAQRVGVEFHTGRVVAVMAWEGFALTAGSEVFQGRTLVLAPGVARLAKYPGEAELLGRGVNGNTTGGMLAVLPDLLVREHPDAVLLMGGTNDIAYGGDLAGARANMGAMAHLIIAGGGLPLIGIPPGLRRPIRREWAELMPERAAELLAEYQSWLRRFAAAFRLPVLDFDRAFTRWGEEGLFQPDGLHPNAAGHCLMAETAAALIRSL